MEINISDYITGRVLSIQYTNGRWRLVAYLSKLLSETEQNYEIHDKEILVVIKELEVQRHLLESTKFKFEVQIDHKNLEYFMKMQKLNWRQARQTLYLSGFDFTLKYVLRVKMEKADELSKRLDLKAGIENNNENQKFMKEEWISVIMDIVVKRPETMLQKKNKRKK